MTTHSVTGGPQARVFTFLMGFVAVAAVFVVLYATRLGPWVFSDSTEYIVSARNLVRGQGLGLIQASGEFQPLSLHPPLYPLVLAGAGLIGLDIVTWARWMNAVLFGASILLAAGAVRLATNSALLACGAGILLLVNPTMIEIHSGAMSEPLFLMAGLASLLLLFWYLVANQVRVLSLAALACGLAILTRHTGLAFLAAGVIALAVLRKGGWKSWLKDTGQYAALAISPIVLWQAWASWQLGVELPRQWNLYVGNLWQALTPFRIELVELMWTWIPYYEYLPTLLYHPKPRLYLAAGLVLAALVTVATQRTIQRDGTPWRNLRSLQLGLPLLGFAIASVGLLAGAFVYALPELDRTDVDQRMLLPTLVALILSGLLIADLFFRAWPTQRWIRWSAAAGTLVLASWYFPQSMRLAADLHRFGAGYTGMGWRNSPTLQAVVSLPPETPIITNEGAALSFLLDRASYDIPELVRGQKWREFTRFGNGPDLEDRMFQEDGAALVLFDTAYVQFYRIYEAQTEERLRVLVEGLRLQSRLRDGAIYYFELQP